jgi:hypothetical protein
VPRHLRPLVLLLAFALPGAPLGCGGASGNEPKAEAPPAPKPKNAADIALSLVEGRIGVMMWNERIRPRPIADRVRELKLLGDVLDGTGLDPIRDVHAAYIASTGITRKDTAVAIVQHLLSDDQLRQGIDALLARDKAEGAWIEGAKVPSARVTVRGQTRVVALVEPGFVAILPEALAPMATRFAGTGGFPDAIGQEAITATAVDPSKSLEASGAPHLPETLRFATAKVTFGADGGADIAFDAESASPEQATKDAAELTETIDRSTSIGLGPFRVRLFDRIPFRATGSQVKSDLHLTASEIDRLVTLAGSLMPR